MRRFALLAVLAPAASLLVAASASAAPQAVVTFTGSVKLPASTGTVVVQVEQGHGVIDPQVLTDVTVASQAIRSGKFSVPVPQSAALTKAEVNGWVPFVIRVESGGSVTEQNISYPVTSQAADGNVPVGRELAGHSAELPAFGGFTPDHWPNPHCNWQRYGRERETDMHIGEIHLTKLRHLTLEWDYGTQADTTMTVGESLSAKGGFSASGTFTVTNSIGTDSGFSVSNQHDLRYAGGQGYLQRYHRSAFCGKPYKVQLDHMVGNSWLAGTGKRHKTHPKGNPYHGCLSSNDPWGNAKVKSGTHFSSDRARATTLTAAANAYAFSFSASTGFTKHIHHNFINHSGQTVYLCGKGYMPNVPTLYNNKT